MIRINLLPLSDRKKTRSFKLPSISIGSAAAIWSIAAIVIFSVMVIAMSMMQARTVSTLEDKIIVAKEEAAKLAPQLERIRQLQMEREEVNRRLGVIAALDRDRYFRVRLLNDISTKMPPNSWLIGVTEQGGRAVTIEGVTFSNYLIADLMSNLENSDRFQAVGLNIAQEGKIEDQKVIQFTLQSQVTSR
jgi:type IV pilus assembly protein PilN